MAELIFRTKSGEKMLRGGDTCWELCELVNVKRNGVIVPEWRSYKYYPSLSYAFTAIAESLVRESDAKTLLQLQNTIKEVRDEIIATYGTAFNIDTSVGDAEYSRTRKAAALGREESMEETCSCGGDCGEQLVIEGTGVKRGERCLPSVGKGLGKGKHGHSGASGSMLTDSGAAGEGKGVVPQSSSRVQRKSKKSQDGEVC